MTCGGLIPENKGFPVLALNSDPIGCFGTLGPTDTNKITENKGNNIKGTWKVLKHLTGKEKKSISIGKLTIDGEGISEKQEISNKLNQYFSSTGEKLSQDIETSTMSPVQAIKRTHTSFKLKQITPKQVYNLLVSLPNGKANGIDMIPNKMLKISAHVISSSLTDIFNCCTSMNTFPDDLKVAKVVPIFKAGAKDDPGNYRPISSLSSVARVFEKLIYDQLYDYFSSNNLLGKQQWGFRKMHSTVLALQSTTNNWILNMNNSRANAVIFLDLKKAFDTVNHDIIIQKLHCYGITGDELKFFRSYLSNRKQCCSNNGRVSDYEDIASCGVPQGSILGPLLFIIYMNDLPDFVKDSNISMYAEDTGLSSEISNALEINSELFPDFLKVCDWLKANKLSLNIVKLNI